MQPIQAPVPRDMTTFHPPRDKSRSPTRSGGFFPHGRNQQQQKQQSKPSAVPVVPARDDDDDEDADGPINTSITPAPAPRPLMFGGKPLGAAPAASAAASSSSTAAAASAAPNAMNLRWGVTALSTKTQELHKRRQETVDHSPMWRIVFIQRVVLFASTSLKRAASFVFVSSSWEECIKVYSEWMWPILIHNVNIRRQGGSKFDRVGDHSLAMQQFYQQKMGIARPPPPALASLNDEDSVGTKALFTLCSQPTQAEVPWLVRVLLAAAPSAIKTTSSRGWSLLMFAVSSHFLETAKVLLDAGADPVFTPQASGDPGDRSAATPLSLAISTGQLEMVQLIVDHITDVDAFIEQVRKVKNDKDEDGSENDDDTATATIRAVNNRHPYFAAANRRCSFTLHPMCVAAARGDELGVRALEILHAKFGSALASTPGAAGISKTSSSMTGTGTWDIGSLSLIIETPLMTAARLGQLETARWLVQVAKVDPRGGDRLASTLANESPSASPLLKEMLLAHEKETLGARRSSFLNRLRHGAATDDKLG